MVPSYLQTCCILIKLSGTRSRTTAREKMMTRVLGFTLILVGTSAALMAIPATPEIDATTAGSALALVAGVLLVMRGRRTK